MKKAILTIAAFAAMAFAVHSQSKSNRSKKMETKEKTEIKALLFQYRDALNASNVEQVLLLYTQNGVFMPSNAPTAIGQAQVQSAYEMVFQSIQLRIEFFIDEIEIAGEYAFARTTSKGTALVHATGESIPEENRELFVLQKENGSWKIDRYMFNKMK